MKVVLVEDEKLASQRLLRLLNNVNPEIEVVSILESVEDAVNWFSQNNHPDLVFMDIQLEDGLSFDIFSVIDLKVPVIFITAFDKYAIQAFKVNSVDYLLKPISQEDLRNALEKFDKVFGHSRVQALSEQINNQKKERFLVKIGSRFRSVPTTKIQLFNVVDGSCFLCTDEGKCYALDFSLDKIEQLVDSNLFFRINRSCIVNYNAVKEMIIYSSSRLKLNLNIDAQLDDVIVSRDRVNDFKRWMDR